MHETLIFFYINSVNENTAFKFQESWTDSEFEGIERNRLEQIRGLVKVILDSGVLSETAAPEVQSYFEDLDAFLNSENKNTVGLFDMGDYPKDLEAWENSFSCGGCGLEGTDKDFIYQRTYASGEGWTCRNCGNETQVSERPNEDNY